MEYTILIFWFAIFYPAGVIFFLVLKRSGMAQPYKFIWALFVAGCTAVMMLIMTLVVVSLYINNLIHW